MSESLRKLIDSCHNLQHWVRVLLHEVESLKRERNELAEELARHGARRIEFRTNGVTVVYADDEMQENWG